MYVYIQSEPGLWTVGFYDPKGKWVAESDWESPEKAADQAQRLNGGGSLGQDWNAAVEQAHQIVLSYLKAYPADIFSEAPVGQHGKTVDSCSASALRAVLPKIAEDIKRLKE